MRGQKAELRAQGGHARGGETNEEMRWGQGWRRKEQANAREGSPGLGEVSD